MVYVLNIIGIVIILASAFCLLKFGPENGLKWAYLLLASDFGLSVYFDYNTISKLMLLIIVFSNMIKTSQILRLGRIKKYTLLVVCFCIIGFGSFASINREFIGYNNFLMGFLTILIGLFALNGGWHEYTKLRLLKIMMFAPIFSIICGILKNGTFFSESGRVVSGTVLYHTPAWLGMYGMLAVLIYNVTIKDDKVLKYYWLNFLIVCLTQMRGGIIFACILSIPVILKTIKNLSKNKVIFGVILIPIVLCIFYNFVNILLDRTFVEGGINSSGRLELWPYFISMGMHHAAFGNGIGFIKAFSDSKLNTMHLAAAHNEYIRLFVETGIVGTIIFIIYIVTKVKNAYFDGVFYKSDYKLILLFFAIAFAILSLTDNTISGHTSWLPFCLLIALSEKPVDYVEE